MIRTMIAAVFLTLASLANAAIYRPESLFPPSANPTVCSFLPCYELPQAGHRVNLKGLEQSQIRHRALQNRHSTQARLALGYHYLDQGSLVKAGNIANSLMTLKAKPLWKVLLLKSRIAIAATRLQSAANYAFKAVLRTRALEPEASLAYAKTLFALERFDEALYALNLARTRPASSQDPHLLWMDSLLRLALGENRPALIQLTELKKQFKHSPLLMEALAIAYARLGDADGVHYHLRQMALGGHARPARLYRNSDLRPYLQDEAAKPALLQMETQRHKQSAY